MVYKVAADRVGGAFRSRGTRRPPLPKKNLAPGTRRCRDTARQYAVMCRTSRTRPAQQQIMAPPKNHWAGSYADRLDVLKRVLKPYRDNNANCLRSATRSARVNLNRHWKSLERAAGNRCGAEERAQNAANEWLEENGGPGDENAIDALLGRLRVCDKNGDR